MFDRFLWSRRSGDGSSTSGTPQRRYERYIIPAELSIPAKLGNHHGSLAVIAEGGAGLVRLWSFRDKPPVTLPVSFTLPDQEVPVEAKATVCWSDPVRSVGVYFEDIPESSRTAIAQWIDEQKRPPDWGYADVWSGHKVLACEAFEPPVTAALQQMAETTCWSLKASGVAIVLGQDPSFECRASTGNAPTVGVSLSPGRGLSGECLATGERVFCVDAASDSRVDGASRERLLLGSACMIPLQADGKVFGLLAVFRHEAGQFTDGQVDTLNTVVESILRSVLR